MFRSVPPRLVVRTSVATLATVAVLLSAVFMVVTLDVRDRVRTSVADKLEAGQRMLSALERRREDDLSSQVAMLAENSTLKAALDIYQSELLSARDASRPEMVATVARELDKLSSRLRPDVLAVTDASGRTIAVAGRLKAAWPHSIPLVAADGRHSRFLSVPSGGFRLASADVILQDTVLGTLQLGTALDDQYARELSDLSGAFALIATSDTVLTTTLPAATAAALTPETLHSLSSTRVARLDGTEYAVRELLREGGAGVYVLDSIDAAAGPALKKAGNTILLIALGAFALAGLASVWLARTLARPIDALSRSLSHMTREKAFDDPLPESGFSLEMDALTSAFNEMMTAVRIAEDETRSAYVGTIRALALTLDARDPYTAGHSERVSALSVAVGQQMGLEAERMEVLRLGALLHDIGKIGVPDGVLRKPGALTAEEFEAIKQHPSLGARILRSVPFLAPHIPIVELHHERPDGSGYPYHLRGDEIPLLARIVHVTDAFDAMTSARAYRPGRSAAEALRELWRCAGAEFDAEIVRALAATLPSTDAAPQPEPRAALTPVRTARLAAVSS
jgi:putative nucleotidyltransferase with HDIG domain